ncbi:hypothetical protein BN1195_00982 [Chryseobacterium oranimense G311]|uniref:hypothetical protein n=1 Tax=Chryseobacterium oranimense TaxID=421058 RepID=UPI0005337E6E|nr:hypothetical protein [Chryseobacterium oranimense]CEJ68693.1 hypothetical protein BN1195_00982 [Chryseobacterium oranimense G311]
MPNYLIEFEEFTNLSINQFIDVINQTEGIKLEDLRVKDLTYYKNSLINPGHGVYIFKTDEKILLIGKARSNSFTERISKHFDIRPGAWFNRLLFITCREHFNTKLDENNYKIASRFVFENGKLILINMKTLSKIDRFESILRGTTETLNKFKKKKYDGNILLLDI